MNYSLQGNNRNFYDKQILNIHNSFNKNRMEILENIKNVFLSPRFVSFYWNAGSVVAVGLLNLIAENLTQFGLPTWAVGVLGLIIAQLTKAISNRKMGKAMGFKKQ